MMGPPTLHGGYWKSMLSIVKIKDNECVVSRINGLSPGGPCSPFGPLSPVAPVSPLAPFSPFSPCLPRLPLWLIAAATPAPAAAPAKTGTTREHQSIQQGEVSQH